MLSASTYVLGCERHHALVVGFLEGCPDDLEGFLAYRLAMQEGIDLLVGHPVDASSGLPGARSSRSAVGTFSTSDSGAPKLRAIART